MMCLVGDPVLRCPDMGRLIVLAEWGIGEACGTRCFDRCVRSGVCVVLTVTLCRSCADPPRLSPQFSGCNSCLEHGLHILSFP